VSIELTALLSKVIFSSQDSSFVVAEFVDSKSAKKFRASGKGLTVGKFDAQQQYKLFGDWSSSPKYGETFQVIYSEPMRPPSLSGVIPFLVNNIKGVGEVTAKKFLESLDVRTIEELLEVCKNQKEKVFAFFKNKREKAEQVISLITGDEVYRSIMVFLHEHNIPPNFAHRIYERYGSDAIHLLKENPYRLISDFRNVGFLRADAIALKLGVDPLSRFRLEAAFVYTLERAHDDGHCCLPRDQLIEGARDVLGAKRDPRFTFEMLLSELRAIYKENREKGVQTFVLRMPDNPTSDSQSQAYSAQEPSFLLQPLFYLPEVYALENATAGECARLLFKAGLGVDPFEAKYHAGELTLEGLVPDVPWNKLSDEQAAAVQLSVGSRFMVLTGGPGCGKTFVLKAIYRVQRALKRTVALCAPTGLAAKRMTASIEAQAYTLHKTLRIGQTEEAGTAMTEGGEGALRDVDVVIVDEASMLSLDLFNALLEAMAPQTRLILVGDVDQLPSVGAGNCLRDVISSGEVPVARLTKIFRQSSESPIPTAARAIIDGRKPEFSFVSRTPHIPTPQSLLFMPCSLQTWTELLLPFLRETLPQKYDLNPVRDVQLLVPMRRGEAGQEKINKLLQAELNPPHPDKDEVTLDESEVFRVGDKVIQTRNNYDKDVFNGDLGYVRAIRKIEKKIEIDVAFDDKIVRLEDEDVDDLSLCYAMTVHKSQGSEFPLVIIPMFSSYYSMLDRNLLYTALTRASRHAIIMGEEWAVKKAIGTQVALKRFTALGRLIGQARSAELATTEHLTQQR
jgi:exodeoxyribonuclease V alpha subunit